VFFFSMGIIYLRKLHDLLKNFSGKKFI